MKIRSIDIKNFRSFEDAKIDFEDYYTAICGQNNSGKSNIIRAILNILSRRPHFDRFTYNSDFPVWKDKKSDEPIELGLTLFLDKEFDSGLIQFIIYFSSDNKENPEDIQIVNTEIQINFKIFQEGKANTTEIVINGNSITDKYKVSELLRRIQFSQNFVFHNSTQIDRRFRNNHGYVEILDEKTKSNIDTKIKAINKELSKKVQQHKNELQSLVGRLQEKYEVNLSFSGLDVSLNHVPYDITLGEKNFNLPLEDWGSGTKNRTLILSTIFNAKNQIDTDDSTNKVTPIVIIEEPESFLHPLAQAEFGRVLQDLSTELEIQVIATTHSPYMLSHHNPKSNLLVKRKVIRNRLRETYIEPVNENNWKEPFELALGMVGPEFEALKSAFFSAQNKVLLAEGEIDKEYFELLRDKKHGKKRLDFDGEIFAYDGFGFLTNNILMKFIKNRFSEVCITLDLDTCDQVESNLKRAGFEKNKSYFIVGKDTPGNRCIEGLIPQSIKDEVNRENGAVVQGLLSGNKSEVKSSKSKLKQLYLDKFKEQEKPTDEFYSELYKLAGQINKTLHNKG
jgi:predicted ATP-dependent endonuclease of OLD family